MPFHAIEPFIHALNIQAEMLHNLYCIMLENYQVSKDPLSGEIDCITI